MAGFSLSETAARWLSQSLKKSRGSKFVSVFNWNAQLRGLSERVKPEPGGRFLIEGGPRPWRIAQESRGRFYNRGLRDRGLRLGESYLLDKITVATGDVIVDCGGNYGDFFLYFLEIDGVQYHGVEPGPEEFACLSKNVAPHACYNIALWRENETRQFQLKSESGDSSLIPFSNSAQTIDVECRRGDEVFAHLDRIRLLKVEAEGAEPEVLKGFENMLDRIDYITVDAGGERGPGGETTYQAVLKYLLLRGFDLVAINKTRWALLFENAARR